MSEGIINFSIQHNFRFICFYLSSLLSLYFLQTGIAKPHAIQVKHIRQIQMCTKTCNRYVTLFTTFGGVTLNQQITEKNSTKLIKTHKTAAIS